MPEILLTDGVIPFQDGHICTTGCCGPPPICLLLDDTFGDGSIGSEHVQEDGTWAESGGLIYSADAYAILRFDVTHCRQIVAYHSYSSGTASGSVRLLLGLSPAGDHYAGEIEFLGDNTFQMRIVKREDGVDTVLCDPVDPQALGVNAPDAFRFSWDGETLRFSASRSGVDLAVLTLHHDVAEMFGDYGGLGTGAVATANLRFTRALYYYDVLANHADCPDVTSHCCGECAPRNVTIEVYGSYGSGWCAGLDGTYDFETMPVGCQWSYTFDDSGTTRYIDIDFTPGSVLAVSFRSAPDNQPLTRILQFRKSTGVPERCTDIEQIVVPYYSSQWCTDGTEGYVQGYIVLTIYR